MISETLKEMMNRAIALEIEAGTRYLWHSVLWSGKDYFPFKGTLHDFYEEEFEHAEQIGERLNYLGGMPPAPVISVRPTEIGDSLDERIAKDIEAEAETIELYNQIIKQAQTDNDIVTEDLFREILADEHKHHLNLTQFEGKQGGI